MASRGRKTDHLPDLVGLVEACEILGVTKSTVIRWLKPGSGQEPPDGTYMVAPQRLAMGPVWAREDIERFRDEAGRRRAGRKPS
jgi:hypothetical protein